MNIYEKMNATVSYYKDTVKPYLKEAERDTWFYLYTDEQLDDFHTDIANYRQPLEQVEDELLALCEQEEEKEMVDTFYLSIILPMIEEIDRVDKLIDEQ